MFGVPKTIFLIKENMTQNLTDIFRYCLRGNEKECPLKKVRCSSKAHPLSEACACGKVKVCKISGDRSSCAKMATMGVLPGSELELLCPGHGYKNCMIKLNGSTLSLDQLTAENIFVKSA